MRGGWGDVVVGVFDELGWGFDVGHGEGVFHGFEALQAGAEHGEVAGEVFFGGAVGVEAFAEVVEGLVVERGVVGVEMVDGGVEAVAHGIL